MVTKFNYPHDFYQGSPSEAHTILIHKKTDLFSQILIPTDFSPASWKAVEVGLQLGDQFESSISIVHIYPLGKKKISQIEENNLEKKLSKVLKNMTRISEDLSVNHRVKPKNEVVTGNISEKLKEFTTQKNYGLVIIGVNSSGDDNDIGSHASELLKVSKAPVLVIPNKYHGG